MGNALAIAISIVLVLPLAGQAQQRPQAAVAEPTAIQQRPAAQAAAEADIRRIVRTHIAAFSSAFAERHLGQLDDPNGVINMKIHNVFVAALGPEVCFHNSLARSLDSSLGNMLEAMAIDLAELTFDVSQKVHGPLYPEQTEQIALFLDHYKNRDDRLAPNLSHYDQLRLLASTGGPVRQHDSDYHLVDRHSGKHYIMELKIGGDLDNKKALAEKRALMEQYAMLANSLGPGTDIRCYFATAYNRFGEDHPWHQANVQTFFCDDELLIGSAFWNFITQRPDGYAIVLDEYTRCSGLIHNALQSIREAYLGPTERGGKE